MLVFAMQAIAGLAASAAAAAENSTPPAAKPAEKLATTVATPVVPAAYVKGATWTETMLASRQTCLRQQAAIEEDAARKLAKSVTSGPIRGDGPGEKISANVAGWRWLCLVGTLEEGGGHCQIWGGARLIDKQGKVTWLSSLAPETVSVGWGRLLADKNWLNDPLRIGTQKFDRGVWVHAPSNVCYRLEGKYERFEAWVGMDAARATGVARFKVMPSDPAAVAKIWQNLAADFPIQAAWILGDSGHNRLYLDWLIESQGTHVEEQLLAHAIGMLDGHGATVRKQFDELRRSKAPASDRRWLDLYVRACRYRECCAALDRIWVGDLQRVLEAEMDELARPDVAADDPRWEALKAKVNRLGGQFQPSLAIDLAALRATVEDLSKALPGRFRGGAPLLARLEAAQRGWQELLPGISRGDEKVLGQVAELIDQTKALRHGLLLGFAGMAEFLAIPAHASLPAEWESQFETLRYDLANRATFDRVVKETFCDSSLVLPSDRDPADVVLRRTGALLADLKKATGAGANAGTLARFEKDLAELQRANSLIDVKNSEARFVFFADACRLRREVAFCNPLLSFDEILFIKRHRALMGHMCDQYYGMAVRPGGGLFVLSHPFGQDPQVRDLLADSTVESGRLKGQKLAGGASTPPADLIFDGQGNLLGLQTQGGSFLSPDLSYDGKQILFAYVECKGDQRHRHHTDPTQGHWDEGRCYHIFKVNVDGSHLEQVTDGTWNDFDPCWLPNGRIAFITERRGGYLRSGRTCPNYNLFDMAADGSQIGGLSFHETNEWHPSVTHDGRIIYTRWDYVDRHGCTAHMPWITTLDGCDSRALHGNFAPRGGRPDMEIDIRAIPGSQRYVATAAPHHGQAFGSLVVLDPRVADDDAMGPVKRLTPEVAFPESQGGREAYGTAWPLSEQYYLCVYNADMAMGKMQAGAALVNYGIYLVDAWGNKELLYRDVQIACQSPIPLRATPQPPVAPELARRNPDSNPAQRPNLPERHPEATVALVNVYDSIKAWPEGTRIKELRVLQVLPMSVPSGGPPHDTALRTATAGDSVVPVRHVLGTVPVAADGSAHFIVPANREMFFQALDEHGLAIQSMRSATYLHEGERLVCAGCHEPKHYAPKPLSLLPLAMRSPPSRLKPDVDGTAPFSYPRLVQPVLDKYCVACHAQNAGKTMNLAREPIVGRWYASYNNLVREYGFHDYGDPYRTTPGQFGAKASKLYAVLQKGHYGVKLSPEDMHRLTLWLDCSSMFYGVYEREGGEAQLRGEVARPTLE
jgi:hypothetical protein